MAVKNAQAGKSKSSVNRREKPKAISLTVYRTTEGDPANPQGEREYLLSESLPLPESLESWLSKTIGPGRYRIEERDAKGRVLNVQSVLIGELPDFEPFEDEAIEEEAPAIRNPIVAPPSSVIYQPPPPAASITELVDALKALDELRARREPESSNSAPDLLSQLRMLEEARKILAPPKVEAPRPQPPPELSIEAAVLRLIKEDRMAISEVTGRLLGGNGDEEPGWIQLFSPLIRAVADNFGTIAQAALLLVQSRPIAAPPAQTQPQAAPSPQNATPSQAIPPGQSPIPQQAANPDAYGQFIGEILQAMAMNVDPEIVSRRIEAFIALNPSFEDPLLRFLGIAPIDFLSMVAQIPEAAHLAHLPHAKDWISKLQELLFPGDGEDSGEAPEAGDLPADAS